MKSQYIQRKRTRGFNLQAQSPDGAPVVSCTRPGKWGNPYPVTEPQKGVFVVVDYHNLTHSFCNKQEAIRFSVSQYRSTIEINDEFVRLGNNGENDEPTTAQIRHELSGHHLACWCASGSPCHVQDVLLPIINGEEPKTY